jgi:hypothetical protein
LIVCVGLLILPQTNAGGWLTVTVLVARVPLLLFLAVIVELLQLPKTLKEMVTVVVVELRIVPQVAVQLYAGQALEMLYVQVSPTVTGLVPVITQPFGGGGCA